MNPFRTILVLALAVIAVVGATTTTASAARPRIDLRGAEVGSYVLDDAGTAHLTGTVVGRPFGGGYTATLAADDGSLPGPGTCEPATGTVAVDGPRRKFLELVATGTVCGEWSDATYVVTHRFTGSYEVSDSSRCRLVGTDGWISLLLATGGGANIEVFDS